MEVCPRCKGSGWIVVRKQTQRSKEIYGENVMLDYSEPCPYCNGGADIKVENIKERANIPATYYDASIENFNWDVYLNDKGEKIDTSKQKSFIDSFLNEFEKWQAKGMGLYIYSKVRGTGKTYLASCICNSLMAKYQVTTKFVSASDLISLSQQESRQGEKNPIDVMCECKILVLDDIGQKTTGEEWMNDLLFRIIEARYQNKLITIFTSNMRYNELRVDDRISSRIDRISQHIPLPEYSYRHKAAYDEKKEFFKELGLM